MKKLLLVLTLSLSLSACANFSKAYDIVTGATVSPQAVIVAANSFDAIEITATKYLRLKKCVNGGPVICRDPAISKQIIPAIRSGRIARDKLEQFLIDNPGQLGPSGLYNVLTASIDTLQKIYDQYNVKVN